MRRDRPLRRARPGRRKLREEAALGHRVALDVGVRTVLQRDRLVEELPYPGHHLGAALRIVRARRRRRRAERVGAVQRVVERAPAGIGGVERVPRVHHRHHQLRTGHGRDLRIDPRSGDLERLSGRDQVADLAQEGLVRGGVEARVRAMPRVDPLLQALPHRERFGIARGEPPDQRGQPGPERRLVGAGAGQQFIAHEAVQVGVDLDALDGDVFACVR